VLNVLWPGQVHQSPLCPKGSPCGHSVGFTKGSDFSGVCIEKDESNASLLFRSRAAAGASLSVQATSRSGTMCPCMHEHDPPCMQQHQQQSAWCTISAGAAFLATMCVCAGQEGRKIRSGIHPLSSTVSYALPAQPGHFLTVNRKLNRTEFLVFSVFVFGCYI
jgi:hypothetical protein